MMFSIDTARFGFQKVLSVANAVALSAVVLLAPVAPAQAQTRTLPDFTDLVEQVGPSVVNIRTLEKVSSRPAAGNGMDISGAPLP